MRVLVVDGHQSCRRAFAALLEAKGIVVTAQSGSARQALQLVRDDPPDLLLVDWELPGLLEMLEQVGSLAPQAQVVILVLFEDDALAAQLRVPNASGYLAKTSDPDQLFDTLRTIADFSGRSKRS